MNKREVQQRVLQNGKPLALSLFNWDERTLTFSSKESFLVIAFNFLNNCNFKTGSYCTFITESNCTFDTGDHCTFITGFDCFFDTGLGCIFRTDKACIFKTGGDCTFNTMSDCIFDAGTNCVVIRKDFFHEVIELKEGQKIRLNSHQIKDFVIIDD